MSDDIVVRRATFDDYASVLKIADGNLWNGYDYLPTLYHVFLQTKRHVFYVAELNGKLVRLTYFALLRFRLYSMRVFPLQRERHRANNNEDDWKISARTRGVARNLIWVGINGSRTQNNHKTI